MIDKLKAYLYKREQNKKIKEIIKFLDNVKANSRLFNYKITDTYFHLYFFGNTKNMCSIEHYDIDTIIDIVCYELVHRQKSIKKEFFRDLKR